MNQIVTLIFGNWRTTLIGLLGTVTAASITYLSGQGGVWSGLATLIPLIIGALTKHESPPVSGV